MGYTLQNCSLQSQLKQTLIWGKELNYEKDEKKYLLYCLINVVVCLIPICYKIGDTWFPNEACNSIVHHTICGSEKTHFHTPLRVLYICLESKQNISLSPALYCNVFVYLV